MLPCASIEFFVAVCVCRLDMRCDHHSPPEILICPGRRIIANRIYLLRVVFIVSWSCYPLWWVLSFQGSCAVPESYIAILHLVSDLFAKNAFGFILWLTLWHKLDGSWHVQAPDEEKGQSSSVYSPGEYGVDYMEGDASQRASIMGDSEHGLLTADKLFRMDSAFVTEDPYAPEKIEPVRSSASVRHPRPARLQRPRRHDSVTLSASVHFPAPSPLRTGDLRGRAIRSRLTLSGGQGGKSHRHAPRSSIEINMDEAMVGNNMPATPREQFLMRRQMSLDAGLMQTALLAEQWPGAPLGRPSAYPVRHAFSADGLEEVRAAPAAEDAAIAELQAQQVQAREAEMEARLRRLERLERSLTLSKISTPAPTPRKSTRMSAHPVRAFLMSAPRQAGGRVTRRARLPAGKVLRRRRTRLCDARRRAGEGREKGGRPCGCCDYLGACC